MYQPILDLGDGAPRLAESTHPPRCRTGCSSPPAEFVPHVERTPIVRELTFLVVADALDSAQQWAKAGHSLGVAINIPYRLLDDAQFAEGLSEMLRTVDPTEPQVTRSFRPAPARMQVDEEVLSRFDALGVRLSLDDAGRAALFAALRVLLLDELKIDVGFVHGSARTRRTQRSCAE